MKRIATMLLAIVMLVSVMAPASVFAGTVAITSDSGNLVATAYTEKGENSNETWIHVDASAVGDKAYANTEEVKDPEGLFSISAASWKRTTNNSTNGLNDPFGKPTGHLYAGTGAYMTFYTKSLVEAEKLTPGNYHISFWLLRYATASQKINVEIKDASGNVSNFDWVDPIGGDAANGDASGRRNEWTKVTSAPVRFEGNDYEYIKFTNADDLGATQGTMRFSAISFIPSTDVIPVEDIAEASFTTTEQNGTVTFTPTKLVEQEVGYDLSFYKDIDTSTNVQPTVEFEISYNGGANTAKYITNFADGASDESWMDIGRYKFLGTENEWVKVTKLDSFGGTLNATKVKFTPVNGVYVERAIDRGLGNAIVVDVPTYYDKWAQDQSTNDYFGPLGAYPRKQTESGTYIGYSAAGVSSGTYEVFWYAMADANTSAVTALDVNVHHQGLLDSKTISYAELAPGEKKWISLGTYTFDGGVEDEFISVGGTLQASIYAGAVKFVPATLTAVDDAIVIIADSADAAHVEFGGGGLSGPSTAAVNIDGTSAHMYSTVPGARATYKADWVEPGTYAVDYWSLCYTKDVREDTKCTIYVTANGKTTAIPYDSTNGGSMTAKLIPLGYYEFTGAAGEGITVMAGDDDPYTSLRFGAVKLSKVDFIDEFVVNPATGANKNYSNTSTNASSNLTINSHANTNLGDGLIHGISYGEELVSVKYYLPDHASRTAPGVYEVFTVDTYFSTSNNNTFNYSVNSTADNTDSDYSLTGSYTNDKNNDWNKLGEWKFNGGSSNEYIEITSTELEKAARFGAVKFVLKTPILSEEVVATPVTGEMVYKAYFNALNEESEINGTFTVPTAVYDSRPSTDKYVQYDSTAAILLTAYNDSEDVHTGTPNVYAALYNEAGNKLLAVTELETSIENIGSCETAYYYGSFGKHTYAAGEKVKVFVWDGLTPLEVPFEANVYENEDLTPDEEPAN